MKKILAMIFSLSVMAILLTGCGQSEAEKLQDELKQQGINVTIEEAEEMIQLKEDLENMFGK